MKKLFCLLLVATVFNSIFSQNQIPEIKIGSAVSLNFNSRALDAEQHQSMGLIPLFFLRGDSVGEFLDLSAAIVGEEVRYRKIIPPKYSTLNMAYGYFFNNQLSNSFSPHHSLFLIENPTQLHRKKSLIWIDRNQDFDFSNDLPDTLELGKSNGVISSGSGGKALGIQLEPFPYQQFKQFAKMSDEAILLQQGNRTYVSSRFSLKETRWNLWYARTIYDGDTVDIGIKDVNCNGKYNDWGIDRVFIKSYNNPIFYGNNSVVLEKTTDLFWMGNSFELKVFDDQLGVVEMKKVAPKTNDYCLSVGKKFPRFRFCVAEKPVHKKQIRRVRAEYVFVYVWSAENPSFIADSAILHQIQRNLPSNIKILMLNHGGSGRYVYRYNKRYETNFLQGFCSPKIAKKLKLQSMPQSFLLDSRQNIVKIGMNARQFQRFIAKNTLSK